MQLLIACSVDVSLVVTAFSELAQFFAYFLHVTVASKGGIQSMNLLLIWDKKNQYCQKYGLRRSLCLIFTL